MSFDFYKEFGRGCKLMKLTVDGELVEQQHVYFNELKKWSKKVNLIAKGTEDLQILENHFLDSLAMVSHLPVGAGLVDVGTGAGFPGLVCKVARPDVKLYLVEPRAKRVSFLNHIVRTLGLKDVTVKCSRIEDEADSLNIDSVSHVTSRAVADVDGFIKMTAGFNQSVKRLCLKGPKWKQELAEAEDVIGINNLTIEKVSEYKLPFSGAERAIVVLGSE